MAKLTDELNDLVATAKTLDADFLKQITDANQMRTLRTTSSTEMQKLTQLEDKLKAHLETTDGSAKMFEQIQLAFMEIRIRNYVEYYREIGLEIVAQEQRLRNIHVFHSSPELEVSNVGANGDLTKILQTVYQTDAMIEALTQSGLKIDKESRTLIVNNLKKISAESKEAYEKLQGRYLTAVQDKNIQPLSLGQKTNTHLMMDMLKHLEHLGGLFLNLFERIYKTAA